MLPVLLVQPVLLVVLLVVLLLPRVFFSAVKSHERAREENNTYLYYAEVLPRTSACQTANLRGLLKESESEKREI